MSDPEIKAAISANPAFEGLDESCLSAMAESAARESFRAGELICREGATAEGFYIVVSGKVGLEVYAPERGAAIIQTIGAGSLLGWSWIIPPYRWRFDARALDEVRAIRVDGRALREECEKDPALGYRILQRVAGVFAERLIATRLQLLDLYGAT